MIMRTEHPFPDRRDQPPAAFTLIEMLVVIVIIAILLSTGSLAFQGSLESQHLSGSAIRLANDLSAAALQAVKENRTLEVHFITAKGEFTKDKSLIRGYQVFAIDPTTGRIPTSATTGLPIPLQELQTLDKGIIISSDPTLSTVIKHRTLTGTFSGYAMKPDGSTDLGKDSNDLAKDSPWCLTLITERSLAKYNGSTLPPDYRTVIINARTGVVRLY